MAQTSGFFEAEWDDELYNEETQSLGDWDRKYLAEEFARYFKYFVPNGVMNDPVDQLKVTAGEGMKVIVSSGFAFINGYWFYNSEQLELDVPLNETPSARVDSVRIRWNATYRTIECIYVVNDIANVRSDTYYDLQLAQVTVGASASVISDANITDVRDNKELCGLINIILADDIGDIEDLTTTNKESIVSAINSIITMIGNMESLHSIDTRDLVHAINTIQWNDIQNKPFSNLDPNTLIARGDSLVVRHAEDDIVIAYQTFTFTNLQCRIDDTRITANSLADVFFDSSSIGYAQQADISVETYAGYLILTAENAPVGTIAGTIRIRVV